MDSTRIVFWGSGGFAFEFFKAIESEQSLEICKIITQPDRPKGRGYITSTSELSDYAKLGNYPIFTPKKIDEDFLETLTGWDIPIQIVASYGQIIPKNALDKFPERFINIHPSLLPKYRGASPIPSAILNGDTETGVTIMLMDQGVDTGKIISQESVEISKSITKDILERNLAIKAARLLIKILPAFLSGQVSPTPQPDTSQPITKKIVKDDGQIDWGLPAVDIDRKFRAFQPWPGIFTVFHDKSLKLADMALSELSNPDIKPGTVFLDQDSRLMVQTGQGSIEILKIQLAGKNTQPAKDFINGYKNFIGSVLPS